MRGLLLILALSAGFADPAEDRLEPKFVEYRADGLGVKFKYPEHWVIYVADANIVMLAPTTLDWLEDGLPPPRYPWFILSKNERGACANSNAMEGRFYKVGKIEPFLEALKCLPTALVTVGYWENGSDTEHQKKILNWMLASVRPIAP